MYYHLGVFLSTQEAVHYAYTVVSHVPVGAYARVVGHLVEIYFPLTGLDEPFLLAIGPDGASTCDGLLKVGVDGRATDRL